MLIALPAKLDAILISVAFFIFGSLINDIKLLIEILKDFDANSILWSLDFLDIKDSSAWAIASKPADAFILFGAEIKNSGIRKKLSGINNSLSKECLIPSTYITALDVTSAPDPAVVGITANFVFFF